MNVLYIVRTALIATALSFPTHIAKSIEQTTETYTQKDLYCLAKNIYHEARGESRLGKIAVAQVTINRMKHPLYWANNICDVVYEKIRGVAQFSWTTKKISVTDYIAWNESKQIANDVLSGTTRLHNFNYVYFHHTSLQHNKKQQHKKIGNHVFYNK